MHYVVKHKVLTSDHDPHIQNTQCIKETNTNLLNNEYFQYYLNLIKTK